MSFVSALPANFPKYLLPPTYDFALGVEQSKRLLLITYSAVGTDIGFILQHGSDNAGGSDVSLLKPVSIDSVASLEVVVKDMRIVDVHNSVEFITLSRTFTDGSRGVEMGSDFVSAKYFDLLTGKLTTSPTGSSILLGEGGVRGCASADYVTLCYKKIGDVLDYETLLNILKALKEIDETIEILIELVKYILNIRQ
jgi:hypothetical protein